jgi:hypothetical protein
MRNAKKTIFILLAALLLVGVLIVALPVEADSTSSVYIQYISGTWDTTTLKVYIKVTGAPWIASYVDEVEMAITIWNATMDWGEANFGVTLVDLIEVSTSEDADIIVTLHAGGPAGVIGITIRRFYPQSEVMKSVSVKIHIPFWADPDDVERVALHELGHAIGLGHSDASGTGWRDIMYPEFDPYETYEYPSNLNVLGIIAAFAWIDMGISAFEYDVPEYITIATGAYYVLTQGDLGL